MECMCLFLKWMYFYNKHDPDYLHYFWQKSNRDYPLLHRICLKNMCPFSNFQNIISCNKKMR